MSKKLPRIKAGDVIKVLEILGFYLTRQSESNRIYKNEKGKRVTVQFHSRKILHPKVLRSILKDAEITVEKFKELLK